MGFPNYPSGPLQSHPSSENTHHYNEVVQPGRMQPLPSYSDRAPETTNKCTRWAGTVNHRMGTEDRAHLLLHHREHLPLAPGRWSCTGRARTPLPRTEHANNHHETQIVSGVVRSRHHKGTLARGTPKAKPSATCSQGPGEVGRLIWVLVRDLYTLSYHNQETLLFTIDHYYGNLS